MVRPAEDDIDRTDLWDLGEFMQKGTKRTKWGTFEDLRQLAQVAREHDVHLYFHAVLNHKAYADHIEKCYAIKCAAEGAKIPRFLTKN